MYSAKISSFTLLSYSFNVLMLHWFCTKITEYLWDVFSALHMYQEVISGRMCVLESSISTLCALSYSCISFSAEVWNQLLAMQLHPLVGWRPVHQWTIITYPSPLVAQEGPMREKICLRALQKQLLDHITGMWTDTVESDRHYTWNCEWPQMLKHQRKR